MHDEKMIIYGDGACPLCVQLGRFCERLGGDAVRFRVWQEEEASAGVAPEKLVVRMGEKEFTGPAAWEQILLRHPALKSLGWLAARLGLTEVAGATLEKAGWAARRFCWRCPHPRPRYR